MSSRSRFVLLTLALVFLYILLQVSLNQRGQKSSQMSGPAPIFRLHDVQGREVGLDDFKGQVVLVNFWATWCPPCAQEMPALEALYRSFKARGFVILAINEDAEGVKAVQGFQDKIPFTFPVLLDPFQEVSDAYGTYKLPESYLIDKQGRLVEKIAGISDWASPSWRAKIEQLLQMGSTLNS